MARSLYRVGDLVRETPTEVGRWLRGANRGIELVPEKPPPEWGVLCEGFAPYSHAAVHFPRNPHQSGEVFARVDQRLLDGVRETPTGVGSTVTYHKFSMFLAPL